MGTQGQIITGARCQLIINGVLQGLFTSVSWSHDYTAEDAYVLGRFSAAEIAYTAQNTITINATGYRVLDKGAFAQAQLPKLQDLLSAQDLTIAIYDRKSDKEILHVDNVRPLGYSSSVNARGVVEMGIVFRGITASDESNQQNESSGASELISR
jgi:hypothetical protein